MLDYFRVPFPSRQGFSAYRFPGLAAHVPFLVVLFFGGFLLVGPNPLLLIWVIAGLYLGRDVAVICHYAPALLLVIWTAMFVVVTEARHLDLFGRRHPAITIGLTILVLLIQVSIARRATR